MKDDKLYLIHISECISRIEMYTTGGKDKFLSDIRTQDAVLRNLHTLAESTQRLSPNLKDRYHEVDWSGISGFRNVLVHDYLGVNLERVWEIVSVDLPEFKGKVEIMLAES